MKYSYQDDYCPKCGKKNVNKEEIEKDKAKITCKDCGFYYYLKINEIFPS